MWLVLWHQSLLSNYDWFAVKINLSLNIWCHTSRPVINARDRPPAGVYFHLWPTFISQRDTRSNSMADVIRRSVLFGHLLKAHVTVHFSPMISLYPMESLDLSSRCLYPCGYTKLFVKLTPDQDVTLHCAILEFKYLTMIGAEVLRRQTNPIDVCYTVWIAGTNWITELETKIWKLKPVLDDLTKMWLGPICMTLLTAKFSTYDRLSPLTKQKHKMPRSVEYAKNYTSKYSLLTHEIRLT